MRLKIQLSSAAGAHADAVTGVCWLNREEVISASDDHEIWRWSSQKLESTSLTSQRKEFSTIYPTSLQIAASTASLGSGVSGGDSSRRQKTLRAANSAINSPTSAGGSELMLLTAADGKIHLIDVRGAKINKTIEAHKGAAILARWSNAEPGGAGGFASSILMCCQQDVGRLLAEEILFVHHRAPTAFFYNGGNRCGEDGCVKMWSKNGMLRSVLAQAAKSVYALDWNGNGSRLVYCAGEECFIMVLNAQTSPVKWQAHNGLVLCISWSATNDTIVTGGEDCRYRLWDGQGRPLWSSASHGFPITSIAWSPNGKMFAVGAFNLLRLCDQSGWSHSLERPNCGSVYCLSWASDGTELVGGCANGQLMNAHIIEKRLMWEQLEAVQTRRKTINIRDLSSEVARERLDTRDPVIRAELGFNFLVVATTKQCYIFSAKNWNTPVITDLKESTGLITLIRLCQKYFLLIDSTAVVQVWDYEGHTVSTIRLLPQSAAIGSGGGDSFNERTTAISNDLVVLRHKAQPNRVHLFDPKNGRTAGDGEIVHDANIVDLCVNQCGGIADRRVAFVDINGDCFLALVNSYGAPKRSVKIGAAISCLTPNNSTNMLAAIQDSQRVVIWTNPTVAFVDRDLLQPTQFEMGNREELGKSSTIVGFIGNTITVCRSDGCLAVHYVPPFIAGMINCAQRNEWNQAVRICRAIKDFLWATLAGLAVADKNYPVAEVCYGQLHEAEKVLFLSELRGLQQQQQQTGLKNQQLTTVSAAQIAQFGGHCREAESALIQSGQYFKAIQLNLGVFRFDRALDLALKSGTHLDTVLGYRQRYLELLGRKENDPRFLKHLTQVEIDWQHIFEKIREDEQREEQQQRQQWTIEADTTNELGNPN